MVGFSKNSYRMIYPNFRDCSRLQKTRPLFDYRKARKIIVISRVVTDLYDVLA